MHNIISGDQKDESLTKEDFLELILDRVNIDFREFDFKLEEVHDRLGAFDSKLGEFDSKLEDVHNSLVIFDSQFRQLYSVLENIVNDYVESKDWQL
ncbi:hypothetical protein [Wolbachia endosymbiont of Nilaparvata lugens]|uniref:hypothetical protein n=1 Tax=Wolbachia endosymbiont of Nilaparvata lugens TaxID=357143 RepID=UPI00117F28B0|nr:hypothetical protein [Wolbachia endosymbiont of Nilaparvata lugens]